MTGTASSPAATGPAGPLFEGQVGAYYLLSLLTGSEPRGVPGTRIERVAFQRGAEGHPLDDVIVHARDVRGEAMTFEIQVKRSITFAPSDAVFKGVVAQIAEASRQADFPAGKRELAIAIARTSRKIDGAYQDLLTWAREMESGQAFTDRIRRRGSANDDMRTFVETFRSHLRDAGVSVDDETVWQILRRLQILTFDFGQVGSASEALARERAVRALHPDDSALGGALWSSLMALALSTAANGGSRDREQLRDDLGRQSFRLAGERRYFSARAALADAARAALGDIGDRVGNVMLTRHERTSAVHGALDTGRYVEIRGDAGVGKSGVLKHFAQQIGAEARTIVLRPGRTTPRGWLELRSVLGFDGSARELIVDLASDGGAIVFIDNLDAFSDEERRTVIDLVREGASVPGLAVIATMRRDFGVDEPNWLPGDALDQLGRAEPVVIDELSQDEVEELRHASPGLASLLADDHPARDVTRNLYRLARLALQPANQPVPRTEIDMAERWWLTGDGNRDGGLRERTRLLKALAEQAITRGEALDVTARPAEAIDALVASESLIDLGNDRVAFRHDVLREWAIANLLSAEPEYFSRLPLEGPAPAVLARGVELAARMALERAADSSAWSRLLTRLSGQGTHGSWRRAVLLAVVRSEIGIQLLTRIEPMLQAERGRLLRELIRTVMAVDVQPATEMFAAAGVDLEVLPRGFNIPVGQSWVRLIVWVLNLEGRRRLPAACIPDVVDLFVGWSIGMFGIDPLTPRLLERLYKWLTSIEGAMDSGPGAQRALFGGELGYNEIDSLNSELRDGFLLFCKRTPELAAQYLKRQAKSGRRHASKILKFRGTLSQAAPAELVQFTLSCLIPKRASRQRRPGSAEIRQPFEYVDHEFLPPSPAQGPFFELLVHARDHGLALVRSLVDHAISFYTAGRKDDPDALVVVFPNCQRRFPWQRSYNWSREGAGHYCVTSALMALEAWGHRRIEAGEPLGPVLADILGPPGSPAAYVLVAVDLLLSHWPQSGPSAVPFLACPELLCLDRQRYFLDNTVYPDILGVSALLTEPQGLASGDSLKKRASRQTPLDSVVGAFAGAGAERIELTGLLTEAVARLGPPNDDATLGDPAQMAAYALNLCDPANWREVVIEQADGTRTTARQYVSPESERQHFERLQRSSAERLEDGNMQRAIDRALDDASRSNPSFAEKAVAWAQKAEGAAGDNAGDAQWVREQAVYAAAMIAMRDGAAELRARQAAWAQGVFERALQTPEDSSHRVRSGLRFNPSAIAFAGLIHALRDGVTPEKLRQLLEVAARNDPAAAHGLGVAASTLAAIDERLPRAVLRSALATATRPRHVWDEPDADFARQKEEQRATVQTAVEAELAWLAGNGAEPDWCAMAASTVRRRRGFTIPSGVEEEAPATKEDRRPEEYVDHQAVALWVQQCMPLADMTKRPWLRDVVRFYGRWTAEANGAGLERGAEISDPPRGWNGAYFELLARCLPGLSATEIDEIALDPITALPDEPFFDVMSEFLRDVDVVFFNDNGLEPAIAAHIRSRLGDRLAASRGWQRLVGSPSSSVEYHIAPAVATLFFNGHNSFQPTKCYLYAPAIKRLTVFLPILEALIEKGPSFFAALVTLNLFEVSPLPEHLAIVVKAGLTWLRAYPDSTAFWIDCTFGRRVCGLIEKICAGDAALPTPPQQTEPNQLLAALVRLGVAEAARLERSLAEHRLMGVSPG